MNKSQQQDKSKFNEALVKIYIIILILNIEIIR